MCICVYACCDGDVGLRKLIDLKIRSYPFPYLIISDTWDILFYCVCFSFVWLLICVSVIIQLMAATKQ